MSLFTGKTALGSWEDRFSTPPADARILKIIHNWPDKPAAQDNYINRFRTQGFGGVVCNASFDQYLESDTKWLAFVRTVNEVKKAGFAMWLYDERGYPSGNAGGITLRDHPEWEARGLPVNDVVFVKYTWFKSVRFVRPYFIDWYRFEKKWSN